MWYISSKKNENKIQKQKDIGFIGTLNGSGLATGRLMISLMENYQNPDGSIAIPDPLKKYMNNMEKI